MTSTIITLSVLLVDDSQYKIDRIKQLLSNQNHIRLTIVMDQIEAQRKIAEEKFDLLILDMQLPLRFGEETQFDGGEKILTDLDIDSDLKIPNQIVALTQHKESEVSLREKYPDIAVIKYDNTSTKWEEALNRILIRIVRAKNEVKSIIYCEGQNSSYYNLLEIPNIEFRGLPDSRAIYLAAKNEKDKFALRDKDFLTTNEVNRLKAIHKNYFILDYYCFENYLYHPDNISEIYIGFKRDDYIKELIAQKKAKLMTIVQDYKLSRSAYFDFNDNNKLNMDKDPEKEIIFSLESDELEVFYPYFDMAGKKDKNNSKSFDKTCLSNYNLDKDLLSKSNWFKHKISEIISLH